MISITLKSLESGGFLGAALFQDIPGLLVFNVDQFADVFCLLLVLEYAVAWKYKLSYILKAMPLLHSATGIPSVDFVNWSLAVEIKFTCCLRWFYVAGNRGRSFEVLCRALGRVLWVVLLDGRSLRAIQDVHDRSDLKYILFIFVGCVFIRLLKKSVGTIANALYLLIFWLAFYFVNVQFEKMPSPCQGYQLHVRAGYVLSLLCGERFFKPDKVLDFMADISYPLYLVHSMIGYTLMSILMDQRYSFFVASNVSLLCSIIRFSTYS